MLHTKFQGHRPFGSGEEDFKGFYHIHAYGKIYSTLRNKMYQNIIYYNINRSFSNRELFTDLMTSTDNTVLKSTGLSLSESNIP